MTDARASFPPTLASATDARHFAEQALDRWDLDAVRDEVRLLVSELVINAVLHAGTPITLVISHVDGRVRVEVSDGSTVEPVRRDPNTTSPTGRGLQILSSLSDDWGVEIHHRGDEQVRAVPSADDEPVATWAGDGKTVWFEVRARPAGGSRNGPVGSVDPVGPVGSGGGGR